ncbi:hypothetical protein MMC16_007490 [Acarospora aff. strigata]|nr:hypothetical protein [Acarospora aff. strigata]
MSTTTINISAPQPPTTSVMMPKRPSNPQDRAMQQTSAIARAFKARDGTKAMLAILTNYLVIAACITLSEIASLTPSLSAPGTRIIYLLATLVIASRLRAFENLVHEASHHNLFASSPQHQRLQFLYSFLVFRVLADYRRSHAIHHRHLGDRRKDPDILRFCELGLHRFPERPIWYALGLPATGFLTYEYLTTTFFEFWTSPSSRSSKTAFWAAVTLVVARTETWWLCAQYYVLPFFLALPVLRYWAEISEHLGLDLRGPYGSSRTNVGVLHAWFMNPHNDGYHTVHHLHAQIPFHSLPEAHRRLMADSAEFRAKTVVSHGLLNTFWQMATEETVFEEER